MKRAALAILTGAALGLAAWGGDFLHRDLAWVFNIAGPWLVVAFVVGATTRRASLATLSLVVGVAVYYGAIHFIAHQADSTSLLHFTTAWVLIALAAGPVFGTAGARWRGPSATALLAAALLGEGVYLLARNRTGHTVFVGELIVGAALPFLLLRGRLAVRALGLAVPLSAACGGALMTVAAILRATV